MLALSIAATGMSAQQTNINVIANNIANSSTVGFKRSQAQFADLIYQVERAAGVSNQGNAGVIPETTQVGLGVQPVAVRMVDLPGSLSQTGNQLDLALTSVAGSSSRGWFQVQGPNNQTLYTRAGTFSKNAQGQMVTQDGYQVFPSITFPATTVGIQISLSGEVFIDIGDGQGYKHLGQMQIAAFANDAGLQALGGNLYMETAAAGNPQVQNPGQPGYASVQQGYIENSNVDPTTEIVNLITAQRNYELNSKVITAADEMWQVLSKNNL